VLLDQHPNLFVYGNRGGGKSLVLRWLAHQMANQHPGFQYAFLHRSFPELNRTHLIPIDSEMKTFWHDGKQSSYHHTDHIAKYSNGSLGFYMVCDSEADVKKALGSNLSMCVFEEACESPWDWMVRIGGSVRASEDAPYSARVVYLGNPIGESIDDLWSYAVTKDVDPTRDRTYDPNDWHAIRLQLEDNPKINRDAYIKRLGPLSGDYKKAWLLGEKVSAGMAFDFFPTKDGKRWLAGGAHHLPEDHRSHVSGARVRVCAVGRRRSTDRSHGRLHGTPCQGRCGGAESRSQGHVRNGTTTSPRSRRHCDATSRSGPARMSVTPPRRACGQRARAYWRVREWSSVGSRPRRATRTCATFHQKHVGTWRTVT
jgi:hypothetical protein